jgi:hypothetical protein
LATRFIYIHPGVIFLCYRKVDMGADHTWPNGLTKARYYQIICEQGYSKAFSLTLRFPSRAICKGSNEMGLILSSR